MRCRKEGRSGRIIRRGLRMVWRWEGCDGKKWGNKEMGEIDGNLRRGVGRCYKKKYERMIYKKEGWRKENGGRRKGRRNSKYRLRMKKDGF